MVSEFSSTGAAKLARARADPDPLGPGSIRITVISDVHYAGAAEQARRGFETRVIRNPALQLAARAWRSWVWLRDPMAHNERLGRLIALNPSPDLVVANGDFTVDSAFVGVSDDAAMSSAREALERLREAYGARLLATIGDHELGKQSLFGGVGGLRLESWARCGSELGLAGVWRRDAGPWVLVGVASSPAALPVFEPELLHAERDDWQKIRSGMLQELGEVLASVGPDRRLILFVHDPSALPFLGAEPSVARVLPQVALTVVGHLHTPAIFRLGRRLAGMPRIGFLGNTVRRYSTALQEARWWREFRAVLCPSPTGIELLKDGGWLELVLDPDGVSDVRVMPRRLPWLPPEDGRTVQG